jgi:hypothetical protein
MSRLRDIAKVAGEARKNAAPVPSAYDRGTGASLGTCPSCSAPKGEPCTGGSTCLSRVDAAGKKACRIHGLVDAGHNCQGA